MSDLEHGAAADSPALRWLLDREALRQLMVDYFCGVDDRDFERVAGCFTQDVKADYGGQHYGGRDALVEFIRGVRFFHTTMHFMGQQLIELVEPSPQAGPVAPSARMVSWAMLAHHGRRGDDTPIEYHNSGSRYIDVLACGDGGWRVSERGLPAVWPSVSSGAPESDDPALCWLIDRWRVRDLLAQWALAMDERDEPRAAACLSADFSEHVEVGARSLDRVHSTTHFLGAPAIEIDGDTAIVESCALVTHRETGEPGKHPVLGFPQRKESTRGVRFRDRLVRRRGRWWIEERSDRVAGVAAGQVEPPETRQHEVRELVDRELIRDSIVRSALAVDRETPGQIHLVGNQEIDVRGDEAQARSYVLSTLQEDAERSHWGRGLRHWHDRLERRGAAWHLAERSDEDLLAGA